MFGLVYDLVLDQMEEYGLRDWRRELIQDLEGRVIEVGAGTGLNLEHYSDAVEHLVLVEPDHQMRPRLEERLSICRARHVEVFPEGLEALDEAAGSFDAVVSTLVMCTVPDPVGALARIRELLSPEGALVFIEHVAAEPGTSRLRWQHRLEPFWKRVAGNCHVTRHTEETILAAGFDFEWCTRQSMRKALPIIRPSIRGVARPR